MTDLSHVIFLGAGEDLQHRVQASALRTASSFIDLLEEQHRQPARVLCLDARRGWHQPYRRLLALRSIAALDVIPVAALTQYADSATRLQLHDRGFAACITALSDIAQLEIESRITGSSARLIYHDLELDPEQYKVWRAGKLIIVPTLQFRLLQFFMAQPGRVFSRQELLENVWRDPTLNEGAVIACMARLRKSLSLAGEPDLIRNAQKGYSLDVDAPALNGRSSARKNCPGNKSVMAASPQCHDHGLVGDRPGADGR